MKLVPHEKKQFTLTRATPQQLLPDKDVVLLCGLYHLSQYIYIYTSRHLENENVPIKCYVRVRAAVWFTLRRKCCYFH
jgi:hypothetical protein